LKLQTLPLGVYFSPAFPPPFSKNPARRSFSPSSIYFIFFFSDQPHAEFFLPSFLFLLFFFFYLPSFCSSQPPATHTAFFLLSFFFLLCFFLPSFFFLAGVTHSRRRSKRATQHHRSSRHADLSRRSPLIFPSLVLLSRLWFCFPVSGFTFPSLVFVSCFQVFINCLSS
jgi:hypothetical protein